MSTGFILIYAIAIVLLYITTWFHKTRFTNLIFIILFFAPFVNIIIYSFYLIFEFTSLFMDRYPDVYLSNRKFVRWLFKDISNTKFYSDNSDNSNEVSFKN